MSQPTREIGEVIGAPSGDNSQTRLPSPMHKNSRGKVSTNRDRRAMLTNGRPTKTRTEPCLQTSEYCPDFESERK